MASHCLLPTAYGFHSSPLWRVFAAAADWGCTDQYEVKIIYQLLQDGILFYHPAEDSFRLHQVVGCTIYFAFPYLEDNPVGYVYVCRFLFRGGILLNDVGHDRLAKSHVFGTLFPFLISVRIGKEEHGAPGQHTELFLSQLALAACRQPYIAGEDGRADNGTLFRFHQDHDLVRISAQQVFTEQALGQLPFLCQLMPPFRDPRRQVCSQL